MQTIFFQSNSESKLKMH